MYRLFFDVSVSLPYWQKSLKILIKGIYTIALIVLHLIADDLKAESSDVVSSLFAW